MRHSITLAAGLLRDPSLMLVSVIFAVGLALVTLVSLAITWRMRFAERFEPAPKLSQIQPSST